MPAPSVLLALPVLASAADADPFEPAASLASGSGTLEGESPHLGAPGFSGGLLAAFAADPAEIRYDDGRVDEQVDALAPVVLDAGWTVADDLRVDAVLPIYAWVDAPLTGFQGQALGDVRLQATIPVWRS